MVDIAAHKRRSAIYPAPTLDTSGRPVDWEPTTLTVTDWGLLRVFFNDVDVTFFRDAPVQIHSLSWAEPFGPERASLEFKQITPFEEHGTGDLAWLVDGADVRIDRYDEDGILVEEGLWYGLYVENEDYVDEGSFGLSGDVIGSLYQMNLYMKRPENTDKREDVGILLFRALWKRLHKAYRFDFADDLADPEVDAPVLGTDSNYRGNSETLTEYVRKLLALVPDWTVDLDDTNTAVIVPKNWGPVVPDWTVRCGQPGVAHRLFHSALLVPNAIYGTGTDLDGTHWANLFPFDDGTATGQLVYQPIAYDPEVNPYDEDLDGDLVFVPGRLVEDKLRIESKMDFGTGVSITEGKLYAIDMRTQWEAAAPFAGNVAMAVDPNEGHRLDMRHNDGLLFQDHRGEDRPLYISRAEASFGEDGTIIMDLTVDTHARQAELVDKLMEGLRNRALNPVPQLMVGRRPQEASAFLWDRPAGSGQIPNDDVVGRRWIDPINRVHCLPNEWTIYRFLASERDNIILTLFDTDPITTFHVSIYNLEPNPLDLPSDPFADGAWDTLPEGFQEGWGSFNQRAGYWPYRETDANGDPTGAPVTGVFRDEAGWSYTHDDVPDDIKQPAFLWAAFWPEADTYIGGELYRGVGQQF